MKIIEVKGDKVAKMADMVEDMLMIGGDLMHCMEELKEASMYGERGMRMKDSRYGKMFKPEDDEEMDSMYERRKRRNY